MNQLELFSGMEVAISICATPQIMDIIFKQIFKNKDSIEKSYEFNKSLTKVYKDIESAALIVLEDYSLPDLIKKKIFSLVVLTSRKLLKWAHYYYHIFGIPFDCLRDIVKRSLFNQHGTINYVTAVNELIRDPRIDRSQRVVLYRCFYFGENCMKEFNQICKDLNEETITDKWANLPPSEKERVKRFHRTFLLVYSVVNGNYIIYRHFPESYLAEDKTEIFDLIIRSVSDKHMGISLSPERSWAPKDYFLELFLYVFDKLNEKEKIKTFQESEAKCCYRVLECLLEWPYQVHFLRYAQLMFGIIRFDDFASILIKIINKNKCYEGQIFNYSCLFKQLWLNAPVRYKNFICREKNESEFYKILIIEKLFELDPFNHFERGNLKLVFEHAKKINDSETMFNLSKKITQKLTTNKIYRKLTTKKKFEKAEIFLECTLLREHITEFKNKYITSAEGENSLKDFLIQNRVKEAVDLLRWCIPKENACGEFKVSFFNSRTMEKFMATLLREGHFEVYDEILEWVSLPVSM